MSLGQDIPMRDRLLKQLDSILKSHPEFKCNFYIDFARRYEVASLVHKLLNYREDLRIADVGAQPFILSAMLKVLGYEVTAIDIEPKPYIDIAKRFNIKVIKSDLERNHIDVPNEYFDCVVLSEVLEHLNPYYVKFTLSEINRILRKEGILILTTPNIASLFRRLKLLLGKQPVYRYHVKEYTKKEIEELLQQCGFEILISRYSEVYDRTLLKPSTEDQLKKLPYIDSYSTMVKFMLKNFNKINLLRVIAYPVIKLIPSLRTTIMIVARKVASVRSTKNIVRWG